MTTKPKIVCLCGSTRFMDAYKEENKLQTIMGNIVLTVGWLPPNASRLMLPDLKKELDELHLRKIDLADFIFVLNVGGYIGESTKNEIAYAEKLGKPIEYLEDDEDPVDADNDKVILCFNHIPRYLKFMVTKLIERFDEVSELDDYATEYEAFYEMAEKSLPPGKYKTFESVIRIITQRVCEMEEAAKEV